MELFKLLGKVAIDTKDADSAIENTTNKAKGSSDETSKAFEKIGHAGKVVATGLMTVGATIGGAFIAAVEGTREYRTEMGKLDTAFQTNGHSSEAATKTYKALQSVLGETDVSVEAANHLAVMTDNEKDLKTWTDICTGVFATFGDSLPIEGLTESANETAKVGKVTGSLADALNWAGISEDEFNEKLEKCSNEQDRQKLIMETLNNTYKGASEQYKETNKDVIEANKANERLSSTMARLGEVGEPIMTAIKNAIASMAEKAVPVLEDMGKKVQDMIQWFQKNKAEIQMWSGVIGIAIATVGGFILVLSWSAIMQKAASALKVVTIAVKALNVAMRANLIGLIVTLILGLVAAFIYLWKNCEGFRKFWLNLWDKIKDITSKTVSAVTKKFKEIYKSLKDNFDSMKKKASEIMESIRKTISDKVQSAKEKAVSAFKSVKSGIINPIVSAKNKVVEVFGNIYSTIKDKINSAKESVKSAVDKIKGFFKFKWSLPKLKVPSFTIKGKFDLKKLSVPKIGIKWNAQGGVLENATLFGQLADGTVLGGGESGAEAIVPLENNTKWIRKVAEQFNTYENSEDVIKRMNRIIELLEEMLGLDMNVYLDSGTLVGELSPAIDKRLGMIANRKIRGNT